MKKALKRLLVSIAILNLMGIILQCSTIKKYETKTVNSSIEKDRFHTIKEKGVLTIVSPPKEVPFFYVDHKTQKISGIDADIINEIAKRLEIDKVDVKESSFSDLFGKLNTDDSIDMAVGGIFITRDGEEQVAFTEPLYKETETVIVPKFSNLNFKSDLKNAVMGVEKGTIFVDLAKEWKKNNMI